MSSAGPRHWYGAADLPPRRGLPALPSPRLLLHALPVAARPRAACVRTAGLGQLLLPHRIVHVPCRTLPAVLPYRCTDVPDNWIVYPWDALDIADHQQRADERIAAGSGQQANGGAVGWLLEEYVPVCVRGLCHRQAAVGQRRHAALCRQQANGVYGPWLHNFTQRSRHPLRVSKRIADLVGNTPVVEQCAPRTGEEWGGGYQGHGWPFAALLHKASRKVRRRNSCNLPSSVRRGA